MTFSKKFIKTVCCVIPSLYLVFVGFLYIDGCNTSLTHADVAVVFGNNVHKNGIPSNRLKARLDRGADLYKNGQVKTILVSGGLGKEGHDEALVMAHYLSNRGIPKEHILVDNKGNTTFATAFNARELLPTDTSIVAVSQLYHLSRSKMALRHAGFNNVGSAYPQYFELRDIYSSLREVPAWILYWIT